MMHISNAEYEKYRQYRADEPGGAAASRRGNKRKKRTFKKRGKDIRDCVPVFSDGEKGNILKKRQTVFQLSRNWFNRIGTLLARF